MATDTLTATCESILAGPCPEEPGATIRWACVHEHMRHFRLCFGCAVDIQHCSGWLVCYSCETGSDPHECHALVVIEWDSGEKTIVQEASRG